MTDKEYEQKKRECWEEFKNEVFNGNISYSPYGGFDFTFDRAYALGKHTEAVSQEEIEKAAEKYAIQKTEQYIPESYGDMRHRRIAERFDSHDIQQAFEDGVNFALGKQEKDAEGEELLTVSRTKIEALHSEIHKAIMDAHDADDWQDAAHYILDILPRSFNALFGSKCLPDEKEFAENANCKESKLTEQKFKVGDIALVRGFKHPLLKHDGAIVSILSYHEKGDFYSCAIAPNISIDVDAKYLEPYTEPKEDHIVDDHEMVKHFDTILKDSFRNDRRCNIAVQMIKALTQSPEIVDRISSGCDDGLLNGILHDALYLTDKLIAECEKGGQS